MTATPTQKALFEASRAATSAAWEALHAASRNMSACFDAAYGEAADSQLWTAYEEARILRDQAQAALDAAKVLSDALIGR